MIYFKNTELASRYHVSLRTVLNWIESAKQGKLDLQLIKNGNKQYIANTSKNENRITELVQKGQKYKNTRGYKVVEPLPEFYERFSPKQIFEIISSLNVHKELPLQYNYFAEGADDWSKYADRLVNEDSPNMLTECERLLETNLESIQRLIEGHARVNIIDIGIGNGWPVKNLIQHLLEAGALNRYIGLDISESMLSIAKQNMQQWFGDDASSFEYHQRDISHDEFGDLIAQDYFSKVNGDDIPINLVLFLGGTINNFEVPDDILRIIYKSMQPDDLFIVSMKLDTPNSRRFFDLHHDPSRVGQLPSWNSSVLSLLNLDESTFEVEQVYSQEKSARFIRAKLKMDISIKFKLNEGYHTITLHKGESILLLRYRHQTATGVMNLLSNSGFDILQTSKTRDEEYFLTVSQISK
jgi:uncharacterized SAM-dependent methyltransferase